MDGDGKTEVLFLLTDGSVVLCGGATGKELRRAKPAPPQGASRWQHLVVCNLRGRGDRDWLLQTSGKDDQPEPTTPPGRFVVALAIEDLEGKPLWRTDRFHSQAHGGLRVADLDGYGRDEVCGLSLFDHDGTWLTAGDSPPEAWHIDSLALADVRPDLPGLEVAVTEEGTRHVALLGTQGHIWRTRYAHREADKLAVGAFDPGRPGLGIWGRGSFDLPDDRAQFVFDARGHVIACYERAQVPPKDWTRNGVEVIWPICWTGEPRHWLAAKERHKAGDVAVFDPMTGQFVERFPDKATRLYVGDVSGHWREELVVVTQTEVRIYWNPKPNPHPGRPRLWTQNHYRSSKMTWNYYSP